MTDDGYDPLLGDEPPPEPSPFEDPAYLGALLAAANTEPPPPEPDDYGQRRTPTEPTEPLRIRTLADVHIDDAPPLIFERADGHGLFYKPGVTVIAGDPGVGKTFATLLAVVQALAGGGTALILDYEDTAGRLRARLEALGCDHTELARAYIAEDIDELTPTHITQLEALIAAVNIDVVVVDSLTPALGAHGLDENSGRDYRKWHRAVPAVLARAGAAVVLIDHRPKPPTSKGSASRGSWAVGSRDKLAAVDLGYVLEARSAFSRKDLGRAGVLDLIIAKDKHGRVGGRGDIAARIELTPQTGNAVHHKIEPPPASAVRRDAETGDPTTALDRFLGRREEVIRWIWKLYDAEGTDNPDGLSIKAIGGYLRSIPPTELGDGAPKFRIGNADLSDALDRFSRDGYFARTTGPRGAKLYRPRAGTVTDITNRLPLDTDLDGEDPDDTF